MAFWLLKTEPGAYSWDDLVRDRRTVWDGITNPLALRHLASAKKGDRAIVYHTGKERRAVGIAVIVKAPYPDLRAADPRRLVVEIEADAPLARPVSLHEIKADKTFAGWELLRLPRLSFVPVPEPMWRRIASLAGT
ncbi:MAG TPA: EVE domain-containing protein [Candidatus Polarisedimenticolia bacterium]|nr:EVE domain-containing protein [Candidatus Polarisedimenticolia bacterium]